MAGYTRQSSYTDGDVITAAQSNDEFNQLLAAFVNTTGHKHDGTASEGPVIGLIGDPGITTPINKVVVSDTNNRVGVFVDVGGSSTEQIRFQDGALFLLQITILTWVHPAQSLKTCLLMAQPTLMHL